MAAATLIDLTALQRQAALNVEKALQIITPEMRLEVLESLTERMKLINIGFYAIRRPPEWSEAEERSFSKIFNEDQCVSRWSDSEGKTIGWRFPICLNPDGSLHKKGWEVTP